MSNSVFTSSSTCDLQKIITKHLQELAEETDKARRSEEIVRYLDYCSRFHDYSANNIWLIMLQRPDSTLVAGYKAWQKLGRQVKHGEKGIAILAPILVKEINLEGKEVHALVGFKTAFVFDVTQTSGNPLPKQPNWKSMEQNEELRKRLEKFALSKGISVQYETFADDTQGVSMGGKIVLSPSSGVKTLAHELVHEILHRVEENHLSHMERELESESAAYIVCRYFGISILACPNYNALQGATGKHILQHFQRIMFAATEIITSINGKDANSCPP